MKRGHFLFRYTKMTAQTSEKWKLIGVQEKGSPEKYRARGARNILGSYCVFCGSLHVWAGLHLFNIAGERQMGKVQVYPPQKNIRGIFTVPKH